jgi:UDP:flavonoid glycosyltransferase YjiC (YdhE family)
LCTPKYALTPLDKADQPLWEKNFKELGACLSIDYEAISAKSQVAKA